MRGIEMIQQALAQRLAQPPQWRQQDYLAMAQQSAPQEDPMMQQMSMQQQGAQQAQEQQASMIAPPPVESSAPPPEPGAQTSGEQSIVSALLAKEQAKVQAQAQEQASGLAPVSPELLASSDKLRRAEEEYKRLNQTHTPGGIWGALETIYDRSKQKERQEPVLAARAEAEATVAKDAQKRQDLMYTKVFQYLGAKGAPPGEADALARMVAMGEVKMSEIIPGEPDPPTLKERKVVGENGVTTSVMFDPLTNKEYGPEWVSGREKPDKGDKQQRVMISEIDEATGDTVQRYVTVEEAEAMGPRVTAKAPVSNFSATEIAKARTDMRGLTEVSTNLQLLRDAVNTNGFVNDSWLNNAEKIGAMKGSYSNARNSMRKLLELGVLQKADLELLERDITDPTAEFDPTGRKAKKLVATLDEVIAAAKRRTEGIQADYGPALNRERLEQLRQEYGDE